MRHKKHKLNDRLHSIPIINNLCKEKRLYLVSYSIPLSCMVVLLLGGIIMISPDMFMAADGKSYAVSVGDNMVSKAEPDPNASNVDLIDGSGDFDNEGISISDEDTNVGIMPLANVNPSLGLSVTNSDKVIETVQGGPTAYSDHLVTITGAEVTNYTLSMSTSSANLTKPSGSSGSSGDGSSTTSGADITGANGATGDSMPANRWGYSVTEESTSNSSYGGLKYATMPTISTTIASGNASSDNTLNIKKKLVIAAKFGEDAAPGNYRQQINLSAVANANTVTFKITYNSNGGGTAPTASSKSSTANSETFTLPGQGSMSKSGYSFNGWSTSSTATSGTAAGSSYTVYRTNPSVTLYAVWKQTVFPVGTWSDGTDSGTTTMQGITSNFCSGSIPAGSTITLKDNRGSSPINYKIIKMGDGTCWMAENLRLINTTINSTNSDMTSGSFTIPASSLTNFGSEMNANDGYAPHAYYNNDVTYGAYYNWYTATAGFGTSSITTEQDTTKSICPKNWKLPAYSGVGSFQNLYAFYPNATPSNWTTVNSINGHILGYSSDDALWLAAGLVDVSSFRNVNSYGYYWSRRASSSSRAYYLYLRSSSISPRASIDRYEGFSVRCVAAP